MNQKIPAIYFLIQGVLGVIWWLLISLSLDIRSLFLPSKFPDEVLLSLVIADIIFVIGSLYASWLLSTKRESRNVCWFVIGATAYATLTCWGWTLSTGEAISGTVAMTLSLTCSTWVTARSRS